MFENSNRLFNLVIAAILAVSPGFFSNHGTSVQEIRAEWASAQQHAERLANTGDAADLQVAQAELQKYEPQIERFSPLVDAVAEHLAPQLVQMGPETGSETGPETGPEIK
jgi:hypothetical protein